MEGYLYIYLREGRASSDSSVVKAFMPLDLCVLSPNGRKFNDHQRLRSTLGVHVCVKKFSRLATEAHYCVEKLSRTLIDQ